MNKTPLIDRFIGWLSPEWAWKRELYRQGLQQIRNYDAGKIDRLQPWVPVNATAEQSDSPYRDILRARARDLERNSDLAQSALLAITRNTVGVGIIPQARVVANNGEQDEKLNAKLEHEFKVWAKKENCDITGQNTFYELQTLYLRRRIVDGEVFCKLSSDNASRIPLKLQGLEADFLATSVTATPNSKNLIVSGVEVDSYYKPLAYWFLETTPDGWTNLNAKRIPAEQILHLFSKERLTQVRGVSELARVIKRMKETGEYLDAELVCAKIAACFALFIHRQIPGGSIGRIQQEDGKRIDTISPGMIEYLNPGEEIRTANPGRSFSSVKDFVELESRLAGAGLGLSYEAISRDVSNVNYSSARQNALEDRGTYKIIQKYMIEHFCKPVWNEFVTTCVLKGIVDVPDYFKNPDKYQVVDWIAPGWLWVDPLKDVKASKEELSAGFNTLSEICAEQGKDWREVLEQRAREKKYAEQLGLNVEGVDANAFGKD